MTEEPTAQIRLLSAYTTHDKMSLHSEWMNTFGEEEVEDTAQSKDVAFWRFFLSELIVSQKWQQFGSKPATGALDDAGHRDTFLVEPFAESKI